MTKSIGTPTGKTNENPLNRGPHRFLLKDSRATRPTLQGGYAKDARQVYHEGRVVSSADPVSLTLVSNEAKPDAADKKQPY